jgi:hypothetical protein
MHTTLTPLVRGADITQHRHRNRLLLRYKRLLQGRPRRHAAAAATRPTHPCTRSAALCEHSDFSPDWRGSLGTPSKIALECWGVFSA